MTTHCMKLAWLISGIMLLISNAGRAQSSEGVKVPEKKQNKQIAVTPEEKSLLQTYRANAGRLAPSTTSVFRATVINTNFIVPIIRFNTVNDKGTTKN